MQDTIDQVKEAIVEEANSILDYKFVFSEEISITVKGLIFIVIALIITSLILNFVRRIITRKLSNQDERKFITLFSYIRWFVFLIIFLVGIS